MPNFMSSRLAKWRKLTPEAIDRNVKVADDKTSATRGIVRNFPLNFDKKSASLEFLVVEKMPVDIIIGSTTLEPLEARIDIGNNFVTVNIHGSEVLLGFEYECTRERDIQHENNESEDFSYG